MFYQQNEGGLILFVLLKPNAKQNQILGIQQIVQSNITSYRLKLAIKAPAIESRANKALVIYLSQLFGVTKSQIELINGELNRNKKLLIKGITSIPTELQNLSILNFELK